MHDIAAPIPIRVLARILGLRDEHLPRLVELADKMLVDTEPEYVGDRAYEGERDEDRYFALRKPVGAELCALGREYYADRRAAPPRRRAVADRERPPRRLPALRA